MSSNPLRMAVALGVMAAVAAMLAPRLEPAEVAVTEPAESTACVPGGHAYAHEPVAVCGTVHGGLGAPAGALTVSCFGEHPSSGIPVDASGHFAGWIRDESCRLTVFRTEGAFSEPGSGVWLEPHEGDSFTVDLWAPDHRPAGMGFQVLDDFRGVYVGDVYSGTPAHRAGLRSGDRVLSIDGVPTSGMSSWEFIERGLDRPGSLVTLSVKTHRGANRLISMRRETRDRE